MCNWLGVGCVGNLTVILCSCAYLPFDEKRLCRRLTSLVAQNLLVLQPLDNYDESYQTRGKDRLIQTLLASLAVQQPHYLYLPIIESHVLVYG